MKNRLLGHIWSVGFFAHDDHFSLTDYQFRKHSTETKYVQLLQGGTNSQTHSRQDTSVERRTEQNARICPIEYNNSHLRHRPTDVLFGLPVDIRLLLVSQSSDTANKPRGNPRNDQDGPLLSGSDGGST